MDEVRAASLTFNQQGIAGDQMQSKAFLSIGPHVWPLVGFSDVLKAPVDQPNQFQEKIIF